MAKKTPNQEKSGAETSKEPTEAPAEPTKPSREDELTDQLKRLQAEFDNYRKRVDQESSRAADIGQEKLLKDFLTITDSIELAIKHTNDTETIKGLQLVKNQLASILEKYNVQTIPLTGTVDPRLHEVYITETNDTVEPNSIIETLQQGYTRNGAVLRTAKVKAARRNP